VAVEVRSSVLNWRARNDSNVRPEPKADVLESEPDWEPLARPLRKYGRKARTSVFRLGP